MLSDWHAYFATQATVAATLTGLLFVALSINLERILTLGGLAGRAAEALLLLLTPVLIGLAGALPQTSLRAFGLEALVVGLVAGGVILGALVRALETSRDRPRREFAVRVGLVGATLATLGVGSVLLVAGQSAGLWWMAASAGLGLVGGVTDAWVLLVEILR